ncbi:helix-turn-helix domain-containing protein [Gordonia soli]|uniref:Putative Xre family DNA-binding protein n=1 Tax=Gordonia soli NBRC 108243 TaxID=1223545 RepID=M0QJW7_9ACTN|nr:helix-turn-helix transcriptional regulator [Gordonia soli]GAC68581.1 putative Xre family DNA-binding protein [Gordonia soli NBRC 108243]
MEGTRIRPSLPSKRLPDPLWREIVGEILRRHRRLRDEKLADTARRAGVSGQYLSELERGLKDPSSEILSAILGALDLGIADLTREVARALSAPPVLTSVPTGRSASGPDTASHTVRRPSAMRSNVIALAA